MKTVLVAFLSLGLLLAQAGGASASSASSTKSCCGKSCPAKKACCKPAVPRAAIAAAAVAAPSIYAIVATPSPVAVSSFIKLVEPSVCGPPGREFEARPGRSPPSLLG